MPGAMTVRLWSFRMQRPRAATSRTSRAYRCSRYRHLSPVPGAVHQLFAFGQRESSGNLYSAADLQNLPLVTRTVNGGTYTGMALWSFLGANTTNEFTQYVLAEGTDGYQVLFSLAELDPSLGAPLDLIPYADTAGQFPANGVARLVIPSDNHAGRYVSNLSPQKLSLRW
jgi:hypothetical protein